MRIRFVSEDRRRGRVRPTRLALLFGGVALVLGLASIAFGIRQIWAGRWVRPVATQAAVAAAGGGAPAVEPRPTAAASPTPQGCPADRARWHLVPYTLPGPGGGRELYMIDPPCVMEQAERAFAQYVDAVAQRGPRWTPEDDAYFFSPATFTAILSGEEVHPPSPDAKTMCLDAVGDDGTPVTSDDYGIVFYTVAQDGLVADLLVVAGGDPATSRTYDCATGELTGEERTTDVLLLYQPMVYDPAEGRWRQGWRYDLYEHVPPEEIDQEALVHLVLQAQGR